jgi:hypothetical protein
MSTIQRKEEAPKRWRYTAFFGYVLSVASVLLGTRGVQGFQQCSMKGPYRQRQNFELWLTMDPTDIANWVSHHATSLPCHDSVDALVTNPEIGSSLLSTMISSTHMKADGWVSQEALDFQNLKTLKDTLTKYSSEELAKPSQHIKEEIFRSAPTEYWLKVLKVPFHDIVRDEQAIKETVSMRPTPEGLRGLSIEPPSNTAKDLIPEASDAIQKKAQAAMDTGMQILDGNKILGGGFSSFAGFEPTRSILAPHIEETVRPDSPIKFVARMRGAGTLLPVIDKLPFVAFYYALVEFFFLRPNLDLYKEEIEDDPAGVTTEAVSDIAVRVGILFVIAIVTLIFT